jgi:hypothetical protein
MGGISLAERGMAYKETARINPAEKSRLFMKILLIKAHEEDIC